MVESTVKSSITPVVELPEKAPIHVLHVDDEAGFLKVSKPCLEMQGAFRVDTASSVEEAEEKMKQKSYDVIVSDYVMPGKDGLEFLKELRESGNKTPFIIFTGRGREIVAIRALNLGADLYVNKIGATEVVYSELAHDIRKLVEAKRTQDALVESEKKWRTLAEHLPNMIFVNKKGRVVYANKKCEEVMGYKRKEFYSPDFDFLTLIYPGHRDRVKASFARHMKGKAVEPHEYTLLTKEGERLEAVITTKLIKYDGETAILGIITDITERKKAETALKESEEKYRRLFEESNDGLVLIDKEDGRILDCNEEFKRQTGRSKEQLLKMKIWDIRPRQLREEARKKFLEARHKGHGGSMELDFEKPSGEIVKVDFLSRLAKIGDREVLQSRCRDITERKKVEDALRTSEEKYRNIVELAPDGIITVDRKGVITSVNNSFSRLTGYSQDEIVGIHFTKLGTLRARDIPRYLKLMSSVMRGKIPPPFEYSYVRKNGTIGWGEAHVGLIKQHGKTTGFQVLLREITGRKMAERTTQESQERFQRLFMNNPEAAIYTDSKFHLLDANPRFKELFGYSLDEIKGKHINDIVVPKDKIREAEMLNKKAMKGYVYHDTVRKKKDGSLVPVSISAAPITVEGKHAGCVVVYKDISDLKRTEKQLQETLEKLSAVGKLTRHDARNKLSAVRMNAFLARQKLAGDPEALEYLSQIESACGEVEKIFDFARIYEKLGAEKLVYIDVEKSLGEAVMSFSDMHGARVVNDCRGLTVLADSLLRQLFYNLIHNSLRHGEKVSQIRVYYETGKDQLKLVYEDDGVGIPKAEKEKIFKEGYGKGTGYGLYLIRKICEVYGWNIQETGKHGKGAQFTITIPKTNENSGENYRLP